MTKFDFIEITFMIFYGILITTKTLENLSIFKLGTIGDILVLSSTITWEKTAITMRKYLMDVNAGVVTFYRFLFALIFFVMYLSFPSTIGISII